MDELIAGVGSVDRTAALKALVTWVDLGVLKEDTENKFRLLETAEEPTNGARDPIPRPGQIFSFALFKMRLTKR
jgi:anaphase-promoting complex subunit 2